MSTPRRKSGNGRGRRRTATPAAPSSGGRDPGQGANGAVAQEARLDRLLRASLGRGAEDYRPDQWRGLREHSRLPLLYPGQFVAFRDHHEGEEDARCLARREVLCASDTLSGLHQLLAELPQETQWRARVSYVEAE